MALPNTNAGAHAGETAFLRNESAGIGIGRAPLVARGLSNDAAMGEMQEKLDNLRAEAGTKSKYRMRGGPFVPYPHISAGKERR